MDRTLKSGKKFVQLLHQSSDKNDEISSKRVNQSDNQITLLKPIKITPQAKVVKAPDVLAKSTDATNVIDNKNLAVDETTQVKLTQAANHNSTANLTQGSTQETNRNQVTDQNESLNQTKNINLSKKIAVLRPPMHLDQNEPTHNIQTQLVTNPPEVNKGQPMIVDNPETTPCDQNNLVATQITNKADSVSMRTPPWIKQKQDVITTDNMLLNIIPAQNIPTSAYQNQTVPNQPTVPTFLQIQINGQNCNQYLSADQYIQTNVVVNQLPAVNFQKLVPTNQLINQSQTSHQVNQSMITVAPKQSLLLTSSNQNLDQNQNGQNINVAQNQNLNQIVITPVSEVNSLKRLRSKSPVLKEPLSKIWSRMNSHKNDPDWLKKTYRHLDKSKEKVNEGNSKDKVIESVVERDGNMPVIQNVTSLAPSYVDGQSLRNNNNAVGSKIKNVASKPVELIVKQSSFPATSGEIIQITNLGRETDVAVRDQQGKQSNEPNKNIQSNEKQCVIENNHHSSKHAEIGRNSRQDVDCNPNAQNPQRSIIQHTSMIVSHQKVETNENKSIDAIETAQETSVINTTSAVHAEGQIIRSVQNDISPRGSKLPVLSVKSIVATEAAANVQSGNCYAQNRRCYKMLYNVSKILTSWVKQTTTSIKKSTLCKYVGIYRAEKNL